MTTIVEALAIAISNELGLPYSILAVDNADWLRRSGTGDDGTALPMYYQSDMKDAVVSALDALARNEKAIRVVAHHAYGDDEEDRVRWAKAALAALVSIAEQERGN